jgi:hypothetical protein
MQFLNIIADGVGGGGLRLPIPLGNLHQVERNHSETNSEKPRP